MEPHDVVGAYQAKTLEYLIAVAYLLLFVPFWRFVNGGRSAQQVARAPVRPRPARAQGLFAVPDGLGFHPGHAWVRPEGDGVVTVGLDDFARKLVGPIRGVRLPGPGTKLAQGEKAWSLLADSRSVDMLSPVDGSVAAVNPEWTDGGAAGGGDTYGEGWLLKVRPARLAANAKQLLSGDLARRWMDGVGDSLRTRMSPELGVLLQDGGQPVNGLAQELDPERWDEVAREFLLS